MTAVRPDGRAVVRQQRWAGEDNAPEISVVIPCLNEEGNVRNIYTAVRAELERASVSSFEILFIDNCSTDNTIAILRDLAASDPHVRVILNSRNFGQMRSPTYAIYQASGAAVLGMCADFQDPPALIGEMIVRWRQGADIILGVRLTEEASFATKVLRKIGYAFFQRFADYPLIPGVTGFGLYDRRVVDCLAQWREPEPFFRAMLVESGFAVHTIAYNRPPRVCGRSNNDFLSILDFAVSGLGGSSKGLLRLPLYFALTALIPTTGLLVLALVFLASGGPALAAVIGFLCLAALAILLFFIGLIGEQVRLISERTREVPLVIEHERINFPNGPKRRPG